MTAILVYMCDPIQLLLGDKILQKLSDQSTHPRLAAVIQISILFTAYVFVLDNFAFAFTVTSEILGPSHVVFYLTTLTGYLIDLVAVLWVLFVLIACFQWDCCHALRVCRAHMILTPTDLKKLTVSITVSPLLCLANHFPYILFSLFADPYHAGSVLLAYFLSFLLFYVAFRQFYSRVALRTNDHPEHYPFSVNPDLVHFPDGDACRRKFHSPLNTNVLILGLFVVTPFVIFYESIIIILLQSLPISKTLDHGPTQIYSIYQGTGILIVALLTYSIILAPSSFSVVRMIDRLGKELELPEQIGRKWVRFADEEKAAFILAFLSRQSLGKNLVGNCSDSKENQNHKICRQGEGGRGGGGRGGGGGGEGKEE